MSKKILLIDDDTNIANYVKFRLQKKGYEIRHIDNGLDGVDGIKEFKPDLVILDMMMPGIDGREVAEIVKEENLMDISRIIVLSGKEVSEEVKALFDLGIHDYLQKPFNIDNLIIRIERALSNLPSKE
ncbi:MAG: response regulator transcription factor [Balneolaceae bacterium]